MYYVSEADGSICLSNPDEADKIFDESEVADLLNQLADEVVRVRNLGSVLNTERVELREDNARQQKTLGKIRDMSVAGRSWKAMAIGMQNIARAALPKDETPG